MSRLLILFALLCVSQSAYSQDLSWRKLSKLAAKYAADKQYDDAADHYMQAYKLNSAKKELVYKAGNNYFKNSDYVNAIAAYEQIKDDFSKFPMADLNYAHALKQDGQYEEAIVAYALFDKYYDGSKKMMWKKLVDNEIKGCELGQAWNRHKKDNIEITWLNGNVNTMENETAPLLFGDDLLYYTSTIGTTQGIYRSQKISGDWLQGQKAEGLPAIAGDFGNGAFSPTKERFYFTTCQEVEVEEEFKTICQLNFIQQNNNGWSAPTSLPEKVNQPNATCTHPTVVHMLGKEVIFFSSDRKGGKGGMDIWYTTTSMNTDNTIAFSSPNNVGSIVNSTGDDVTPFYDVPTQTLYFSSNGYQTIGGYDIFSSKGDLVRFGLPAHMGVPINSSADDLFYITSPVTESYGLFVSNRKHGNDKIHTRDLDIFAYNLPAKNLMVKGTIYEQKTKQPILNSKVALYEVLASGKKRLLSKINSSDGIYKFKLLPNKKFIVESDKDGYPNGAQTFNTINLNNTLIIEKDIFIDKSVVQQEAAEPIYVNSVLYKPTFETPSTAPKPSTTPTPKPSVATAPKPNPTTRTNIKIATPAESVKKSEASSDIMADNSTKSKPSIDKPKTSTPKVTDVPQSSKTEITKSKTTIASTPEPAPKPDTSYSNNSAKTETAKPKVTPSKIQATESKTTVAKPTPKAKVKSKKRKIIKITNTPATPPVTKPTPSVASTPPPSTTPTPSVTTTPQSTRTTSRDITSSSSPTASTQPAVTFSESSQNRTSSSPAPSPRRSTTSKVSMPKGEFYKIQLIAVKKYNPDHKRYREIKQLARLESEYIPNLDLERVLMGDYFSLSIAQRKLATVKNMTDFSGAYIVRYKNGRRMGPVGK